MRITDSSGIYAFVCLATNKRYVGSSLNIRSRIRGHIFALRKGTHFNPYFQNAWNKYGEEMFVPVILELCDESVLREQEQHWINYHKAAEHAFGYNIAFPVKQRAPSARMQERWEPALRQRISDKALDRWSSAEFRQRTLKTMHNFWDSADGDALRAEHQSRANAQWLNDEHREAMSAIRAERWKDPKYAQERSDGSKQLWANDAYRTKVTSKVKASCNDPEYLAALRKRTTEQWARKRKEKRERLNDLGQRLLALAPTIGLVQE